jgi:hypothetical protein
LFNQAKAKLQLTCPFDAYFFTLQRKWLNELKNQLIKGYITSTSTTESTQVMLAETELFDEKQQLFDLMFQKIRR